MKYKYWVIIPILLLIVSCYFIYQITEQNNLLKQQIAKQQQEIDIKNQELGSIKDSIKNQPFPLAGTDEGMPDTGIIDPSR